MDIVRISNYSIDNMGYSKLIVWFQHTQNRFHHQLKFAFHNWNQLHYFKSKTKD